MVTVTLFCICHSRSASRAWRPGCGPDRDIQTTQCSLKSSMPADTRRIAPSKPAAWRLKAEHRRLQRAVREAIWRARLLRAEALWQRLLIRLKS